MQFKRSALIEAIDAAILQDKAAVDAVRERNAEAVERHRREWLDLHAEKWQTALKAIRAKLRRDEPITDHDIPRDRSGYGSMALYRTRSLEQVPVVRTVELQGLRQVLQAVADEEISSAGLRSLGVSSNTLRLIVPLLGAASVRSDATKSVS